MHLYVDNAANMNQRNPNNLTTEDGLVLKNVEKIEEVTSRLERRVTLDTYSWQVSRHLRRDFNLIASKVFKLTSSNKDIRFQIHDLLMEIASQAVEFDAESSEFSDLGDVQIRTLPLRLVSVESAMLFNSLKQADKVYGRTNWAVQEGKLTMRRQTELAEGFEIAYGGLKRFLFGREKVMTAGELGKEMGIA